MQRAGKLHPDGGAHPGLLSSSDEEVIPSRRQALRRR